MNPYTKRQSERHLRFPEH